MSIESLQKRESEDQPRWKRDTWVDEDDAVYRLSFRLGRIEGRLTLAGLAIEAEGEKAPVTTKVIRRLPLGGKIREWVDIEEQHDEWIVEDIKLDPFKRIPLAYANRIQARLAELTEKHESPKADPSSTLTFANYARIGALYLASYRMGFSPTQVVADDAAHKCRYVALLLYLWVSFGPGVRG